MTSIELAELIKKMRLDRNIKGPIQLDIKDEQFVIEGTIYSDDFKNSLESYKYYLELNYLTLPQQDLLIEIQEILNNKYGANEETPYFEPDADMMFVLKSYLLKEEWAADTVTGALEKALKDLKGRN